LLQKNIIEHALGVGQGIEATKGFLLELQTGFPDFKTICHIIAEEDKVVVFTNTTGTHKGPFIFAQGVKPSGKTLSFQTADLYKIENGKIVEHRDVAEFFDILQKMRSVSMLHPQLTSSSANASNNDITNALLK